MENLYHQEVKRLKEENQTLKNIAERCVNFSQAAARINGQRINSLQAENELLKRQLIAVKFRNELNAFAKCFYRDRLREIESKKENKNA